MGISGYTSKYEDGTNFTSNVINFTPVAYILTKSPSLNTFQTTDSTGQRTIIKKVPVTTLRGTNIVDGSHRNDPLDCAKLSLRSLEFTLTDEAGNELDLGGQMFVSQ